MSNNNLNILRNMRSTISHLPMNRNGSEKEAINSCNTLPSIHTVQTTGWDIIYIVLFTYRISVKPLYRDIHPYRLSSVRAPAQWHMVSLVTLTYLGQVLCTSVQQNEPTSASVSLPQYTEIPNRPTKRFSHPQLRALLNIIHIMIYRRLSRWHK